MAQNNVNTSKWINNISRTPEEVEQEYNTISSSYEETVHSKGYNAPEEVAKTLVPLVSSETKILDIGCGTGLVGRALNHYGFSNIVGIDISSNVLQEAKKKGVYTQLLRANILEPLDFLDRTFGAVVCVAVFSRFEDEIIIKLLKEFARVLDHNGVIIFTHREDLVKTSQILDLIALEPELELQSKTNALPYLPLDENYEQIGVHYFVVRVIKE